MLIYFSGIFGISGKKTKTQKKNGGGGLTPKGKVAMVAHPVI